MMTDGLRSDLKAGFKRVGEEFVAVRTEMKAGFMRVDDEFVAVRTEMQAIRAEIRVEGETTRRHFDIVAEQFREYAAVLADGTARNTERLDEHDKRLTALEKPLG